MCRYLRLAEKNQLTPQFIYIYCSREVSPHREMVGRGRSYLGNWLVVLGSEQRTREDDVGYGGRVEKGS